MRKRSASLEVTVPGETTSIGVMTKKLKEPKAGDKARITPKKISLALIPLRAEHPEIIQGLAERLKERGRFAVLDSEKGAAFLNDKKQRDVSLIKEMGKTFNLDVVVTVEVHPSDSKYLVTAGIFYADDARPLDTIVAMLDLRTKRDALGEVNPFFAPPKEEKSDIAEPALRRAAVRRGGPGRDRLAAVCFLRRSEASYLQAGAFGMA